MIGVTQGSTRVAAKKQAAYRKAATKLLHALFEDEPHVVPLEESKVCRLTVCMADVAGMHRTQAWCTDGSPT